MFPENTRILIVDDMDTMLAMLTSYLTALGFKHIVKATDGVEALQKLKEADDGGLPINVIICDWDMPKMTGIEMLKHCQGNDKFKEIPFIFVTVEGNQKNILEAITHGVTDYIVKPYTQSLLKSKLERVLNQLNEDDKL